MYPPLAHQIHRTRRYRAALATASNRAAPTFPKRQSMFWPIVIALFAIAIIVAAGCAPHLPLEQATKPLLPSHVPANLQAASGSLNWLLFLGVVGIGVGSAAYFIIPGDHRLALGVILGSLAMGGTALIVATALPFLPWTFAIVAALGLAWLAARLLSKSKANAGAGGTA